MNKRLLRVTAWFGVLFAAAYPSAGQEERIVRVDLAYHAPGHGPKTDFSPYGTQVKLSDLPSDAQLPEGATRPAKTGTLRVGLDQTSWIDILATADSAHPQDLCRLYIDAHRNGNFTDDGPPLTATPTLNEKTKAWWSSFDGAVFSISYGPGILEPYMVNFWAVREGDKAPNIIRYSVGSWRSGTVNVDGIEAGGCHGFRQRCRFRRQGYMVDSSRIGEGCSETRPVPQRSPAYQPFHVSGAGRRQGTCA
jgi:hypothetical protein